MNTCKVVCGVQVIHAELRITFKRGPFAGLPHLLCIDRNPPDIDDCTISLWRVGLPHSIEVASCEHSPTQVELDPALIWSKAMQVLYPKVKSFELEYQRSIARYRPVF